LGNKSVTFKGNNDAILINALMKCLNGRLFILFPKACTSASPSWHKIPDLFYSKNKKGSQTCAWLPTHFFDRKLFENKLSGLKITPDVGEILNYNHFKTT